ncbi:MAG TPA: DUF5012 domain-containing protein [Prolixibacteraceae bacterium]|jgi:hypothetical protein|nr:DUF5012 domain-containing protein [Prolixibacteraceae bacterium]
MKKFHYIFIVALILLTYSCKRDLTSEGVSKVTNYVTFNLTAGPTVTFPKGTTYVDPGYKGTEGTTDVTSKIKVTGTVDGNTVGLYTLQYSAVNADGFSSSTERTVIIYDPAAPETDLTGDYLSDVSRAKPSRSFSGLKVSIQKLAPGFFFVSDFLGGFYDQGSNYNYGPAYAMSGYMQLNADNTLTLVSSHDAGFGDSLDDLTNGIYDPATQGLTWHAFYVGGTYDFTVTLKKVQ